MKNTMAAPLKDGIKEKNSEQILHVTKLLDSTREQAFDAWTDAEKIKQWWGPKNFTTPFASVDLRTGGIFQYCMRSPDGMDFWGTGTYREIEHNERLVYVNSFADERGNAVPPSHYGIDAEWPSETMVSVTFVEQDGKTRLTVNSSVPSTVPAKFFEDTVQGWNEMINKLAEYLAEPGKVFDIPAYKFRFV